jgi:hypothetical protein
MCWVRIEEEEEATPAQVLEEYLIANDWEGHRYTITAIGEELHLTLFNTGGALRFLHAAMIGTLTQTGDYEVEDITRMVTSDGELVSITYQVRGN